LSLLPDLDLAFTYATVPPPPPRTTFAAPGYTLEHVRIAGSGLTYRFASDFYYLALIDIVLADGEM
jgi:hypothetical protein